MSVPALLVSVVGERSSVVGEPTGSGTQAASLLLGGFPVAAENFKSARMLAKPRCRTGEIHKARVICSPWKWPSHVVFWGHGGHPDARHSDCCVAKRHSS